VTETGFEAAAAPVFFGAILGLIGLIFRTFGRRRVRMIQSWSRTTGVVVTGRHGRTTGMTERNPTFQWRDQYGTEHQHTSNVYASLGPAPGQEVPVLFDPENPSRAVIDSGAQSGRMFVALGTGMLVAATAIVLLGAASALIAA